ncbi:hypothetical protein H072_2331 [Dactylellina haptotyla CBS 200.50]|uniref:Uncharacterized protein n=1 Tax=Dactylellina haptotyla (strain CBS 200.50) TaxID=1284197 RepID=S8AKV3_DACHA|nr:hypothetical protein H072_2331 [Dactylellina haptotyla CBS 200.50]
MPPKRRAQDFDATPSASKREKIETGPSSPGKYADNQIANWPAPRQSIQAARDFILSSAISTQPTLLVPDRDCDGLSSGHILRRTLIALGKTKERIAVHFIGKGRNIHAIEERRKLESRTLGGEKFGTIIVLDQGSNDDGEIATGVSTLILDHHFSKTFPRNAVICSACESPPIATSSLLTYIVCKGLLAESGLLSAELGRTLEWLALVGICGDLGPNVPLHKDPYPNELHESNLSYKTSVSKLVPFLNAPRRTPSSDPGDSWELLRIASDAVPPIDPKQIMVLTSDTPPTEPTLLSLRKILLNLDKARNATFEETEKCSHTPPIFSEDGRLAILTINSAYQIHPLIATRWAGHLKSKKLVAVGCANTGYLPGKVNFSCRLAKTSIKARNGAVEKKTEKRRKNPDDIYSTTDDTAGKSSVDSVSETDEEGKDDENIISLLKGYAAEDDIFALKLAEAESKGEVSFAKGHKEASGGSLTPELWEMFATKCLKLLTRDGSTTSNANSGNSSKEKKAEAVAKKNGNTLDRYFFSPKKKKPGS